MEPHQTPMNRLTSFILQKFRQQMITHLEFAEFRPRGDIARHVVKCKYPFTATRRVIQILVLIGCF